MKPYTTYYGREIPARIMSLIRQDILNGVDSQTIQNDRLRDFIPEHSEDIEEANEVLSVVEARMEEAGEL